MNIAAIIPIKLKSSRVKGKNKRLLCNKELMEYVIDTACEVFHKKDIYLYSYDDEIREYAHLYDIQYMKEDTNPYENDRTNNDFIYDFMQRTHYDYVVMLNTTSPFISRENILEALDYIKNESCDVLLSVSKIKSEAVDSKYEPINFTRHIKTCSQHIPPIYVVVWGISAWKVNTFIQNYDRYGCGIFGSKENKIMYQMLDMPSAIDIDTEKDLRVARLYMNINEKQ